MASFLLAFKNELKMDLSMTPSVPRLKRKSAIIEREFEKENIMAVLMFSDIQEKASSITVMDDSL